MTKFSSFKKQQKLFENWRGHTNEAFRPYDAGYQRSDDERRTDNRSLQRAAEEYADKMHDAWVNAEAGSDEERHYDKEYKKHSANAALSNPLPIHQLEEQEDDADLIQPEPEDRVPEPGDDDYVSDFTGIPGAPEPEQDENLSEDEGADGNRELIRLLQQISDKLDILSTIDGSIDYLASSMTGENPMLTKVKQDALGRIATGRPAQLGMGGTAKVQEE